MSVWLSKGSCVSQALILLTAIILLGAQATAMAQAAQAELTGDVRDAAGAGVANATVTVKQTETGDVTKTTPGKDGVYTVTNLRPGTYTITVEAASFRRFVQEGVRLTTGRADSPGRGADRRRGQRGGQGHRRRVAVEDRDRQSRAGHPEPPHR